MKKRISRLLITVMLTQILLGVLAPVAYARSQKIKRWGDWRYIETAEGIVLTQYRGTATTVKTPDSIDGQPVTGMKRIFGSSFFASGASGRVRSLILSDSLKKVDAYVLYESPYRETQETLPDGTVSYVYTEEGWDFLKFGKNVRASALNYLSFQKVAVDPNNPFYTVKDGVLYNKQMTKLLKYPMRKKDACFVLPKRVKTIQNRACAYAKFKKIKLNRKLEKVGKGAFSESQIQAFRCNENLKSIGKNAFAYCARLTRFRANKKLARVESDCFEKTPLVQRQKGAVYADTVFLGWNGEVPKRLKLKKGTRVVAHNAMKQLNDHDWSDLLIELEESTALEKEKFEQAYRLEELIMPSTVRHIGDLAFAYNRSLKKVTIKGELLSLGFAAFSETPFEKKHSKEQKNGVVYLGKVAVDRHPRAKRSRITLKSKTRVIAGNAFSESIFLWSEKKRLRSVKLPKGLKGIGDRAFYECKYLKKLTIPKSVIHIGAEAFENTDIRFTVYKNSYAHKYLKKHGFRNLKVIPA